MECLACGPTTATPSGEHIFASWLLKEFDPDISMSLFRRFADGSRRQERVEIRLDSFRLKQLCEPCNNGWMSRLEDSVKPIILSLIRSGRRLDSLSREECRI